MPTPPSTNNYTIPAGQKIYFNDGAGERVLGNIAELDCNHEIENLEHKSNMSGEVLVDKVVPISRKLEFPFALDEVVLENFRMFYSGGSIETIGAGTNAIVDAKLTLTGVNPVSVGLYYGLTAVTVRQFLDYCYLKDDSAGPAWVDNSAEADSLAGTPFEIIAETADELYLGKISKFDQVYWDLQVNGSYTLAVKYWNGSAWAAVSNLGGAADGIDADGVMSWDLPVDWALKEVNGVTAYFIQITASVVTTPATVNCIRQDGVDGTDYFVIPGQGGQTGRIDGKIVRIAAGMFVDGEQVKVSFTYATWTSRQFAISRQGYLEGSARIEIFPSPGLGIKKEYLIPKCQIRPNGNISEDASTWEKIPLVLTVLADTVNNPTAPYGWIREYEAAS